MLDFPEKDLGPLCAPTWNIHIENFSPHRHVEKCRIIFVDPMTSTVIARRSLDCRFVSQATIRELALLFNAKYCTAALRVTHLSRRAQQASRSTALAIGAIKERK